MEPTASDKPRFERDDKVILSVRVFRVVAVRRIPEKGFFYDLETLNPVEGEARSGIPEYILAGNLRENLEKLTKVLATEFAELMAKNLLTEEEFKRMVELG